MAPLRRSLLEQGQDGLRRLVGDRQGLDAKLLLGLQRLQAGRSFFHVGVDQRADTRFQRIGQTRHEVRLIIDAFGRGAQIGGADFAMLTSASISPSAVSALARSVMVVTVAASISASKSTEATVIETLDVATVPRSGPSKPEPKSRSDRGSGWS